MTIILMLPIVLLCLIKSSPGIKVFILVLFVLVFSLSLLIKTNAKRHEVFASTAAYAAVLVVFMANVQAVSG